MKLADEEDYWLDGRHYTVNVYPDGTKYELVQDMDGNIIKEVTTYADGRRESELYSTI